MPNHPFTFSVSEFTTYPWTFEQDVEAYARLGVDAIEVCEFKLDPDRIEAQLALTDRHGLAISSAQPEVRTLFPSQSQPEPVPIPDRTARFRRTIDRFGGRAAGVPFVTNTGNPPNGNVREVFDTAIREYRALAEFAADRGALLALEPLNASIMNVESAIWTVEQAMQIVEAVDRASFGLCLDLWNTWQNARIGDAIRAAGDRIFIVQVSDWRTPRSYQDRLIVGDGDIPFAPLIRAIHEAGYRGHYELEIFSSGFPDTLWEGDLEEAIVRSREGLKKAWKEAF
jgi:sugar phosphate isomerase/epimerase